MISLRMKPGQIAFTRMPRGPYSTAPAFVTAITPAFVAEYVAVPNVEALRPPTDDQLTITPP
jgi:hypothetical protein